MLPRNLFAESQRVSSIDFCFSVLPLFCHCLIIPFSFELLLFYPRIDFSLSKRHAPPTLNPGIFPSEASLYAVFSASFRYFRYFFNCEYCVFSHSYCTYIKIGLFLENTGILGKWQCKYAP